MGNCVFDSCELINGLVLGLGASLIVLAGQGLITRAQFKRKFRYLVGEYEGYGFQAADPTLRESMPQSKARIEHLNENKLSIEVVHDGRKWNGDIVMELETSGSIIWRYDPRSSAEFNFGLKRCIAKKTEGSVHLLLVGEPMMDGTYRGQYEGRVDDLIKKMCKPNKEVFIKTRS